MNSNRQNFINHIFLIFTGLMIVFSCEIQSDQEVLDADISDTLDSSLSEALDVMSDDPEGAISILDDAIDHAKSLSSSYYIGKALWYQAYIYKEELDNVSKAYFGYKEALKYLEHSEDATLKAKISNNLAILNQYYGHHDAAIDIYVDVLKNRDDLSQEFVSDLYYNLGRSYKLKRDESSLILAEEAFTKAMEAAKNVDYHKSIANVNNQIGTMYKDLGNYDIARIAYQNTIRTYEIDGKELGILDYVGKAYHGIGVTYMEEKDYPMAIKSFTRALEYEEKSSTIFITKYDLGTVLNDAGQTNDAIAMWKDALTEKHNKSERVQVEIYSKLTSALAANEQYKEAANYAQIYNEHINNILSVGEKYKNENNQVIFADIIREYDEFNQSIPFYREPWAIALMFFLIAVAVYAGSSAYYQSKLSTKVSDTRSEIQVKFQNIKLD